MSLSAPKLTKGTGLPRRGKYNDRVFSQVREQLRKQKKRKNVEEIIREA